MKRLGILLIAVAGVMVGNGCEEDTDEGGIHDITLIDSQQNECYGSFDPCSWTFRVSFRDKADYYSHYYWAELQALDGGGEAVGKPIWLYNDGSLLEASVTGQYFDDVGYYALMVYRCDNAADAGNARKATRAGELMDHHPHIGLGGNQCSTCCCSDNEQRFWAFTSEDAGDITGVACSVDTKYGTLCGESCNSDDSAHSAAWISMSQEAVNRTNPFIQFGYMRGRGYWPPYSLPDERMYFEYRLIGETSTAVFPVLGKNPPEVHSTNHLVIHYDSLTNRVWFFRNDTAMTYLEFESEQWTPGTGQFAIWSGEIRGYESDMPGTYSNKCHFSVCKYRSRGNSEWTPASFRQPPDLIGTSDLNEWELKFYNDTDSFDIWDVNPQ